MLDFHLAARNSISSVFVVIAILVMALKNERPRLERSPDEVIVGRR